MKKELIVDGEPKSPIAETFRTLRTNLQFMNSKKTIKTLLVTSTMPGEGKTWVSANLAITFAQADKKVLLIDADMRKGRINSLFQVDKIPGLSNYLSGYDELGRTNNADILKFIKATAIENLYVIPNGNIPPNPSELLASDLTEEMLEKLEDIFDIIILDGTPSLIVTDAIILSRLVDTTIVVASHNLTKKEQLQKIKKSIENVGGKIAGVVYNRIPVNASKYESTYYYSGITANNSSMPARAKRATKKSSKDDNIIETRRNSHAISSNDITDKRKGEILEQINDFLKTK